MSLLTACAHANRFIGEWYTPTDRGHIIIDAHQVSVVSADGNQSASGSYRMPSPQEIDVLSPTGQVGVILRMNEDGNSFEAEGIAPYGSGTYLATRVK